MFQLYYIFFKKMVKHNFLDNKNSEVWKKHFAGSGVTASNNFMVNISPKNDRSFL